MTNNYKDITPIMVAIDSIIFGFKDEKLHLLLIKRGFEPGKGKWSLMGSFLKKNETLDHGATRILHDLTGIKNVYQEQLYAFGEIERDPEARVISVAYFALINMEQHNAELTDQFSAKWFELKNRPELIFDHNAMVEKAIMALRARASARPIGFELLPEKFTMRELRKLYEAIYDQEIDKRNFINKVKSFDILEKLDEKDMTSSKKGSFLYKFVPEKYKSRLKEGLSVRFKSLDKTLI